MIEFYIELMFIYNFCNVALKFMMKSKKMNKNSNFEIFKVMKSMSKTIFSHCYFSSTLNDKSLEDLIFHVLYLGT
jgi:hypothetical protein